MKLTQGNVRNASTLGLALSAREAKEPAPRVRPVLYQFPRLSPDGRKIMVQASGQLWVLDTERPTIARLQSSIPGGSSYPSGCPTQLK